MQWPYRLAKTPPRLTFGSGGQVLCQFCTQNFIQQGHSYGIDITIPTFPFVCSFGIFCISAVDREKLFTFCFCASFGLASVTLDCCPLNAFGIAVQNRHLFLSASCLYFSTTGQKDILQHYALSFCLRFTLSFCVRCSTISKVKSKNWDAPLFRDSLAVFLF